MKVQCIDVDSPRSDNAKKKVTSIRLGHIYEVVEILDESGKYSLVNDDFKISRHSQYRFKVVDNSPVPDLRSSFNKLSGFLRSQLKHQIKENHKLKEKLEQYQ